MPKFGSASRAHLAELRPELQLLMNEVVKHVDCTIIDGGRSVEEQRKNVAKGVSKTMASKHLVDAQNPRASAVDVMPWPFNWSTIQRGLDALKRAEPTMQVARCYWFAGFVAGMAAARAIPIRQGVDWDGDREVGDHSFIDLPHNELK